MSNIEDDIKKLNKFNEYENTVVLSEEALYEIQDAIEHILSEREQDKAKIKELEAKLEFKEYGDLDEIEFEKYMSQFIPKQKVKKKIREAKHNRKYANTAYEYTEEDVWDIVKDNLEELLEEGK
mgnify:CR=1 FL=1